MPLLYGQALILSNDFIIRGTRPLTVRGTSMLQTGVATKLGSVSLSEKTPLKLTAWTEQEGMLCIAARLRHPGGHNRVAQIRLSFWDPTSHLQDVVLRVPLDASVRCREKLAMNLQTFHVEATPVAMRSGDKAEHEAMHIWAERGKRSKCSSAATDLFIALGPFKGVIGDI